MVLTNTDALFTPIPLRAPRLPILGICNLAPYMHVPVGPVAAVGVTRLARIKARRGAHPYHVLSTSHRHCSTPPGHREVRFQTEYQTSSRRTTPTPRSNDLQETSSNLTSESSDDDEGDDAPGAAAAIPIPRDREGRVIALGRDGHSIEKWSQLGRSKYRAVKVSLPICIHAKSHLLQKVVDQVVKNHLHHSTPFHKQPENRKRVALDHVCCSLRCHAYIHADQS